MKHWTQWTRKELLELPEYKEQRLLVFRSILVVPTYKLENKCYRLFAVIAVDESGEPMYCIDRVTTVDVKDRQCLVVDVSRKSIIRLFDMYSFMKIDYAGDSIDKYQYEC